ncbi:MAG: murein transglycosylase [Nitrospirae bacterium]|nr:MAG: murein transglycosylase [Nitrospirota bacterium]
MHRIFGLFILSLLFIPSPLNAFCFEEAGRAYDVNPKLLETIAMTESNLRPDAVNKNRDGTQDIGLMQINSSWIEKLELNAAYLIEDPCYNTFAGAKILRQCIDRHGYDWEAVGCYNASDRGKKIRYSWRVFNRAKAENNASSPVFVNRNEQKTEDKKTGNKKSEAAVSRFYFSVREK